MNSAQEAYDDYTDHGDPIVQAKANIIIGKLLAKGEVANPNELSISWPKQ